MSTTARINAKGTKDTGITEELAQTLHNNLGRSIIAIVELRAEARTEKLNGDETVNLVMGYIEPATTTAAEDHLRELQRGFYYERQIADGQAAIDDSLAPKVADVIRDGQRHRPHPFTPVDASQDNPICDVCGIVDRGTTLHSSKALANPFEVIQGGTVEGGSVDIEEQPEPDAELTLDDDAGNR